MVTIEQYRELMEDRPNKFGADDVHYRRSDDKRRCDNCLHFYQRRIDHFGTCEIFRSKETDEDGVLPNFVCDLFTRDGDTFPLLEEK